MGGNRCCLCRPASGPLSQAPQIRGSLPPMPSYLLSPRTAVSRIAAGVVGRLVYRNPMLAVRLPVSGHICQSCFEHLETDLGCMLVGFET